MNAVWAHPFQSTRKLVALSLADQANDSGECYPSIPMIAERCGLSERAVHIALNDLEREGMFSRVTRSGRSTLYKLSDPCTWCTPSGTPAPRAPLNDVHPTPERRAPLPLNDVHPTPERRAPITTTTEAKAKAKEKRAPLALPSWLPVAAWDGFVAYRKRRGGWTDGAAKFSLRTLTKLHEQGHDPVALLEMAEERGWSGIFPPREFGRPAPPGSITDRVRKAAEDFGDYEFGSGNA